MDNSHIIDKDIESPMQTTPTLASQAIPSQNENTQADADVETHNSEEENSNVGGVKKRKLRSIVWDHFERKVILGKMKGICNDCKKALGGEIKNGMKHLLDHMKVCVNKKQKSINQSLLHTTKFNDGLMKLNTYNFDQDHSRSELANMIILHEYPLSMVDHVGFRRYSHSLQPLFKVVSRNTIKGDIMKIFEFQREKSMKLLNDNASRIALTTDMWTSSNQKRGFMAITSHFISESWRLQSMLVRFIYVPCPHTSEVLANVLVECLLDWNLDHDVTTSELDVYLGESLLPRNTVDFDILCWWKINGIKYPTLHDVAKDVLAIPITTVASESTFSTSGRIVSTHCSRLHSKTLEALMCARDWLWKEIEDSEEENGQIFDNDSDVEESESYNTMSNTGGSSFL